VFPARQWGPVRVLTGGAGHNATTKGLTEVPIESLYFRMMRKVPGKARAAKEGSFGRSCLLWRRIDGVPSACVLKALRAVVVFLVKGSMNWAGRTEECSAAPVHPSQCRCFPLFCKDRLLELVP